ncbi:hypothetical protein WDW89_02780 [Deltaproteobacteria bacterium TL4]
MTSTPIVQGKATLAATQACLESCFQNWHYQKEWKRQLSSLKVYSSLLGIEFETLDFPQIQQSVEHLITMGCNHFQWHLKQPEELAFVRSSPFSSFFKNPPSFASRQAVILSLRLPLRSQENPLEIMEQAKQVMGIEQWDRVIFSDSQNFKASEQQNQLSSYGIEFNVQTFAPEQLKHWDQQRVPHVQVPFNLVQFKHFLSRRWTLEETRYSLPRLLEHWGCSVSFRSPFSLNEEGEELSLLSEQVNLWENYTEKTALGLEWLQRGEDQLNQTLRAWPTFSLKPEKLLFSFVDHLKEARQYVTQVEEWESYVSNTWFPPFQQQAHYWSLQAAMDQKESWAKQIRAFMKQVGEVMALHSEALRSHQAYRMRHFVRVLESQQPESMTLKTFGAKTLLLLCSTPWPETVFFPWKDLDSSIEYLGLMRFPLLKNAGVILKELATLTEPHAPVTTENNPLLNPMNFRSRPKDKL